MGELEKCEKIFLQHSKGENKIMLDKFWKKICALQISGGGGGGVPPISSPLKSLMFRPWGSVGGRNPCLHCSDILKFYCLSSFRNNFIFTRELKTVEGRGGGGGSGGV